LTTTRRDTALHAVHTHCLMCPLNLLLGFVTPHFLQLSSVGRQEADPASSAVAVLAVMVPKMASESFINKYGGRGSMLFNK
jgi:hypothetical protein